ncbi:hypothetical protein A1O1_04953 [Capronia coronata CBS 617.96]|uniref:Uncharacterized protein n=1 Tax=Capronia coronata CBS 617.96 TaxID=1182541 RepID=W9YFJ9_9EURO|nr:uncharacterized protein A1O1_04953 [Capronia coronata CBS 617.96]EXJ88026.1 hypothetical protein A1O1_04953 [Capronia coronata CBS 617.96]
MLMTLQANEAPCRDNILAASFSWLILAGYVVFPGTFTSMGRSTSLDGSKGGKVVKDAIRNVPLAPFAIFCYVIGMYGTFQFWRAWRKKLCLASFPRISPWSSQFYGRLDKHPC